MYWISTFLSFLKALITNPRSMGAVAPSSKRLADEMAAGVIIPQSGMIIELGAGTGVVTNALLNAGIPPDKIIIIERSSSFVQKLRVNFPRVQVIEGDAANLINLLTENHIIVNSIVSSLPLLSLPKEIATVILDEVYYLLPPGGRYIQFTYSFKENPFLKLKNLRKIYSKRIWLNIPPARVDVYTRL